MTVFLDLDGVLANFQDAFVNFHGARNPYLDEKNHGVWDMYTMLGMTGKQAARPLGYNFWANLEKMDDAGIILKFAKSLGPVVFLSSPAEHSRGCCDGKRDWVANNYPHYKLILCPAEVKHVMAGPKKWLLDDKDENVWDFRRSGGRGILVPRPWNRLHKWGWDTGDMLKCMKKQVQMYKEGKL